MKKLISLILLLTVALTSVSALAATPTDLATRTDVSSGTKPKKTEAPVTAELSGVVVEVMDDGFLISDETIGAVRVITNASTYLNTADALKLGDYVTVEYNGVLTRSTIPQTYAQRVTCYFLIGTVNEVDADGFLMTDENDQQVYVRAEADVLSGIAPNNPVTVFFNGAMTMSLPGQVNAQLVRLYQLTATVEGESDGVYHLTDADGMKWDAEVNVDSKVWAEPLKGSTVCVSWNGMATKSIPAQIQVMEIFPAEATVTIVD